MRSPLTPQLGWSSVFQAAQCFSQFSVSGSLVFHSVQCFRQFSVSGMFSIAGSSVFGRFQGSGSVLFLRWNASADGIVG